MKLVKFLTVGVANTAIGLGVIFAAMALGAHYLVANAIGYSCGVLFSFVVNRSWTFAHDGDWRHSLVRWMAVSGLAYAAQFVVVACGHGTLGLNAHFAQLAGAPVYTMVAFLGARRFAFPGKATS